MIYLSDKQQFAVTQALKYLPTEERNTLSDLLNLLSAIADALLNEQTLTQYRRWINDEEQCSFCKAEVDYIYPENPIEDPLIVCDHHPDCLIGLALSCFEARDE